MKITTCKNCGKEVQQRMTTWFHIKGNLMCWWDNKDCNSGEVAEPKEVA